MPRITRARPATAAVEKLDMFRHRCMCVNIVAEMCPCVSARDIWCTHAHAHTHASRQKTKVEISIWISGACVLARKPTHNDAFALCGIFNICSVPPPPSPHGPPPRNERQGARNRQRRQRREWAALIDASVCQRPLFCVTEWRHGGGYATRFETALLIVRCAPVVLVFVAGRGRVGGEPFACS